MALQFGPTKIGAMQYNGVTIGEAMYNGQIVYRSVPPMPVVAITGTSGLTSRDQFRAACIAHGTTFDTVVELPFLLDTSNATNMDVMFSYCSALTSAPVMDTAKVTSMGWMFLGCTSLVAAPVMNTSQVTNMGSMFDGCAALTYVPVMDTAKVTNMGWMFADCAALTDGNVRLIGKHPSVDTTEMIYLSGLTREPFAGAGGTIAAGTLANNSLTAIASHTISAAEGAGKKTLTMHVMWLNATATKSIRIDRNGVQVAGPATGQYPTLAVEVACSVGDVITYKAIVNSTTTNNRIISSGSWGAWVR